MKFDLPLINAHTHAAMIGFRGLAEDVSLQDWLNNYIWPAEARIDREFVYRESKRAIDEMKRNKIAAFCDMYYFQQEVARAAIEKNIPVLLGSVTQGSTKTFGEGYKETEELIKKYEDHPLINISIPAHSIYAIEKDDLIGRKALARKYNLVFQIHLAETKKEFDDCVRKNKKTPTQYLDDLGLLDNNSLLAHCVWLTDGDIKLIAKSGASIVHCPLSNLKLGNGIAPISKMMKAGINIAIGTDSAATSNRLDVWEAGKITALLQKGINHDPTVITSLDVVKMMTINGMKALHIDKIGDRTISDINKQIDGISNFDFIYHLSIGDFE